MTQHLKQSQRDSGADRRGPEGLVPLRIELLKF